MLKNGKWKAIVDGTVKVIGAVGVACFGSLVEKYRTKKKEAKEARKDEKISSKPSKSGDDLIDSL